MLKFIINSTALFALAAAPAFAQQVIGVTPTQAVIFYHAPNGSDCQVKVSQNSSMTPLAHDVDPVLFPGSELDSRPGNLISPSRNDRYFVIGHKRADVASDGKRYSRALQAFSEYFYQVSCSGNIQTGRFVTANLPLGNDYPELPPFDATAFGNYAWPTIDWNDQSRTYIDPMTGVELKRATGPGWYGQMQTGAAFSAALDVNATRGVASGWTNVSNILSGASSKKASYSGAGGDPIFLAFDPSKLTGYDGKQFAGWAPSTQTLDNILLRVFGSGSGTVSACLSDDSGGHCASPAVNIAELHSGGGNPAGTYPAACASDGDTGCFPNNGFWGGWNFIPRQGQMDAYSGTVNVSGSTITAGPNTRFDLNWKQGGKVSIAGTAPACPNNLCTISLVNSSSSLTIVEFAPTETGAAFGTANSGVMVWINKAGGNYAASISINFDYAYSDQATMPLNGSMGQCSPQPTTVSYAADGITPITPVAGELCLSAHNNGSGQYLYLFIPSTGETRFLSPMYFFNGSDPEVDQVVAIKGLINAFDATDPNTFYIQGNTSAGPAIFSGTYNAAVYKYRTYSHSLYPSATASYIPGKDVSQYWFQAPAWADAGITWVNLTKASQGKDLNSQIAANDPNWDPSIYNSGAVTRVADGKAIVTNTPKTFGETIGLEHAVDLATGSLYASATTYSAFPARWCASHSDYMVDGWYGLVCNPLGGAAAWQGNPSVIGVGPWEMTPSRVLKNGTFSSDTSLTSTSPMDACPAIPAFLTSFLPANPACVTFQSQMACSHTPNANEKLKWPCETNPAWSEIQQIAPGDGLLVRNGHDATETLLVVSVTSLGAGNYQFTAIRGTTSQGNQAAPNGWKAYAVPPLTECSAISTCTNGAGFWYKLSDPTFTWRADPGAFAEHSDLGKGPKPGTDTYCLASSCRYNIPFEQQIDDRFRTAKKFQDGSFAGVPGAIAMQAYPSLRQVNAPPTEQVWRTNYRHLNPGFGAGAEVASDVGVVSYSLVPGTTGVYKFTSVNGGLHYKQVPVAAYAGYHLLKEVSSPAKGDIITDSTPWQYCVVLNPGECRTGSAAGEVYMSVPQGLTRSDQNCVANWYDDNYPCVFSPPAKAGFMVQEGTSKDDPNGINWRRISMGFSGYGRQFEFATFIPDPTGKWAFSEGYWLDGVRNDLLIAKLPPWPNPQDVTVNRTNFIRQSVQIGALQNMTSARVRFGYTENGNVTDFFCTARQETCVTAGPASTAASPYWFVSENEGWQPCTNGCSISVPAIPGRVLFYVVDRQDGAGNTVPGTPQVVVVR